MEETPCLGQLLRPLNYTSCPIKMAEHSMNHTRDHMDRYHSIGAPKLEYQLWGTEEGLG
jgi:hypothetical protein